MEKFERNAYDSFNPLTDAIVKYQDPQAADKICKIQKELDETMDVMHQTIMQGIRTRG